MRDFEVLARESRPKLMAHAMKLGRNRELAGDLVQRTLIRCWNAQTRIEEGKSFTNYALRVLDRIYLDHLRDESRRLNNVSYDALKDHAELFGYEPVSPEDLEGLYERLNPLVPAFYRCALPIILEQRPYALIMADTGITLQALRNRVCRLKRLIRRDFRFKIVAGIPE